MPVSQETYDSIQNGVRTQGQRGIAVILARHLNENYSDVRMLIRGLPTSTNTTNAQILEFAEDAIENRSINGVDLYTVRLPREMVFQGVAYPKDTTFGEVLDRATASYTAEGGVFERIGDTIAEGMGEDPSPGMADLMTGLSGGRAAIADSVLGRTLPNVEAALRSRISPPGSEDHNPETYDEEMARAIAQMGGGDAEAGLAQILEGIRSQGYARAGVALEEAEKEDDFVGSDRQTHEAHLATLDGAIRPLVSGSIESQAASLGRLTGRETLTAEEQAALTTTMTRALGDVADSDPPMTDPIVIRDSIRDKLQANAAAMGFSALSAEEQNHLFTIMANESTANYITTNNIERTDSFDQQMRLNPTLMRGLAHGAARRKLETDLTSEQLNDMALVGQGSVNRAALIDTLAPVLGDIAIASPAPTREQSIARVEAALTLNKERIGITTGFHTIATAIVAKMRNEPQEDPAVAINERWDAMVADVPERYRPLLASLDRPKMIANILHARGVVRANPNFYTLGTTERRNALQAALQDAFRNGGSGTSGALSSTVTLGSDTFNMNIPADVASESFANLVADRLTGTTAALQSYLPRAGERGVTYGGTAGRLVQTAAEWTGTTENLRDLDTERLDRIRQAAQNLEVGTVASEAWNGAGTVVTYWWDRRPGWMR